jgi:hypothetical protein
MATRAKGLPYLRVFRTMAIVPVVVAVLVAQPACGEPIGIEPAATNSGWSWHARDIPGVPGGFRATIFDSSRNCLWILTRFFREAGVPLATLSRFNIADGSADVSLLEVDADGFIRGSMALDSKGSVWMAWGKMLVRYDPNSRTSETWQTPPVANVVVDPLGPVFDGNVVAMAIAPDGEVWTVGHGVHAAFGFNSSVHAWDRTVLLPLGPRLLSQLAFSDGTHLIVSGVLPDAQSALAVVDIASGASSQVITSIRAFAVSGQDRLIVLDGASTLGTISLSTFARKMLDFTVPVTPDPNLAADKAGNAWFTLAAIGVGEVAPGSTSYTAYPIPPILGTGSGTCGKPPCEPGVAVRIDPDIQSMTIDASGNIWVTTGLQGGSGAKPGMPLYELEGAQ